jgi:riboflavin kinase / FMN adenylyltransferase
MHVFSGGPAPANALGDAVVAMGNFDGFHLGHQAVVGRAAQIARRSQSALAVLTFDPHPARFFKSDLPPFQLMSLETKLKHLAEFGVNTVLVLPFTAELAAMSAQAFVADLLIGHLNARHLVAGYDFTFGRGRSGTMADLPSFAAPSGVGVTPIEPVVGPDSVTYSSTAVRQALEGGDPRCAAAILGKSWQIEGRVQAGDQRGRTIGFPTANVALGDYARPRLGVYAVRAQIDGRGQWYEGVANFGRRPTFDKTDEILEVFLFDFSGDLYDRVLLVEFVEFVRPEQKFPSLDSLKAQIASDSATALKILRQPMYARSKSKPPHRRDFELVAAND